MSGRLLDAARIVRLAVWLHLGSHLLIAAPDLALLHAMYRQEDVVCGRGRWIRSLRDSAIRRCEVVEDAEDLVTHHIERLRIVSDELWNIVHVVQSARTPRDTPKIRAVSAGCRQRPPLDIPR